MKSFLSVRLFGVRNREYVAREYGLKAGELDLLTNIFFLPTCYNPYMQLIQLFEAHMRSRKWILFISIIIRVEWKFG